MKLDKKHILKTAIDTVALIGGATAGAVVTIAISHNLPEATKLSQKIIQKAGALIVGYVVEDKASKYIQDELESIVDSVEKFTINVKEIKNSGPAPDLTKNDIIFNFETEELRDTFVETLIGFEGRVTLEDVTSIFDEEQCCINTPSKFRKVYGWDSSIIKEEMVIKKNKSDCPTHSYVCVLPPCVYFGKE